MLSIILLQGTKAVCDVNLVRSSFSLSRTLGLYAFPEASCYVHMLAMRRDLLLSFMDLVQLGIYARTGGPQSKNEGKTGIFRYAGNR